MNCVLVNYVTRIIGVLMNHDTNGVYEACMRTRGFVDAVLRQMRMVAVIDVLLGLISVCDPTNEVGCRFLTWLASNKLIDRLVDLIPSDEYEESNVASQVLIDIIAVSRTAICGEFENDEQMRLIYAHNAELSPLISTLQSKHNCATLVKYTVVHGLMKRNASVARSGLGVIVELLSHVSLLPFVAEATQTNAPMNLAQHPLIMELLPHVKFMSDMIDVTPMEHVTEEDMRRACAHGISTGVDANAIRFPFGVLAPPLGSVRVKIIEYFTTLLHVQCTELIDAFVKNQVLERCFALFFRYKWNNFLHTLVVDIVDSAVLSPHVVLSEVLFRIDGIDLLNRIVKEALEYKNLIDENKVCDRGYMGHITQIANVILMAADCHDHVREIVEANQSWLTYCMEILTAINAVESKPLGGQRPIDGAAQGVDQKGMYMPIFSPSNPNESFVGVLGPWPALG